MPHLPIADFASSVPDMLVDALDLVDVGILMLDRDMGVRYFNRRQAELIGLLSGTPANGLTYRGLLERAAAMRLFAVAEADLPDYLDQQEAAVRAGAASPTHIDFQDGTRLLVSCSICPDGGRILTYADVSGEVRPDVLDNVEHINADLRFENELLGSHAADLASLAEETHETARKLEDARQALEREVSERRQLETQLRRSATTDGLTGALNRAGFLALAEVALEQPIAPGQVFALLMIDADHFKSINDRFGHAGGDQALKHLVTTLRAGIRASDLLGRLGGEEFAIVLPATIATEAERIAERLVARIAASSVTFGDAVIEMTVSVGLVFARPSDVSIERVIARADDALYRAKNSGRNRVVTERWAAVTAAS